MRGLRFKAALFAEQEIKVQRAIQEDICRLWGKSAVLPVENRLIANCGACDVASSNGPARDCWASCEPQYASSMLMVTMWSSAVTSSG